MSMYQGKKVVITGAGSGIGRALAQALDRRGAQLAICDIQEESLAQTAASLSGEPYQEAFDVSQRERLLGFIQHASESMGQVDILINNAGVALVQRAQDHAFEDFQWLFNINFWGMVNGTQAVLPQMLERNEGIVINLSSLFGLIGYPSQSAYCASKFAIRGYTETLQIDLAETGVRLVTVHPGGIATKIAEHARVTPDGEAIASKEQVVSTFRKLAKTSPEQAAEVILKGVERGKKRILVGTDAKILSGIQRLMPGRYARTLTRLLSN